VRTHTHAPIQACRLGVDLCVHKLCCIQLTQPEKAISSANPIFQMVPSPWIEKRIPTNTHLMDFPQQGMFSGLSPLQYSGSFSVSTLEAFH
jgi:hypothetical protein